MFPFSRRPTRRPKDRRPKNVPSDNLSDTPSDNLNDTKIAGIDAELIVIGERRFEIHRQRYRRSIGLTLRINGRMRVTAPVSASLHQIRAFLTKNEQWIMTHLRKYEVLRAAHPRKHFRQGEELPLLGRSVVVRYEAGRTTYIDLKEHEGELIVGLPPELWREFDPAVPHPELARAFTSYFERVGRSIITTRLAHYSDLMGLRPSGFGFRAQKTRWGSCSSKGRISLNWRLVIAPMEVIDYVVIHELAHLKFYNHSPAFWNLVETFDPNWRSHRHWLKERQYDADFLAKRSEIHDES